MDEIKTGRAAKASEFAGYPMPHDPAVAGTIGKRKTAWAAVPDPKGNRAERRAAARLADRR